MAKKENKSKEPEVIKSGVIINRKNFPVTISYDNQYIVLGAGQQFRISDISKLGELPKHVVLRIV